VRRLLDAAEEHINASDGDRASGLLRGLVRELPAGPLRARALHRLAYVVWDGGDDRALAEQALAEAGEDHALRAWVHITLAALLFNRGEPRAALAHAASAVEHADRQEDPFLRGRARLELAMNRFFFGGGVQRELLLEADRLERAGSGHALELTARGGLGVQLFHSGDLEGGRRILLEELERLEILDNEVSLRILLTDIEVRAGRWPLADEYARRALALALGIAMGNGEAVARWACALVDAHLGRVEAARMNAERVIELSEADDDLAFVVQGRNVLGFLALSLGDAEEAVRRLEPLPGMIEQLGIREPTLGFEPNLAEALVLSGDIEAAREVTGRLAAVGRELDRPRAVATALRCSGLIAAAEGRLDEAIADHVAALRVLEGVGQPFERARSLLALGTAQRRAKRRGEARASLDAALAVFAELGAELWVGRAREEIARLGGRPARDRDELTPTERRVALAAEGRSNREIAAELFVTERTVEANLTRAYRKLGVRSRTQLARRLPTAQRSKYVGFPLSGRGWHA
jgi:DNA-binding CsgD family transcriptional regulator